MTSSEFNEKKRIAHGITKIFCKQMNCLKMKKIIDTVFDTHGLFKDKYTYSFCENICGDFCGMNQGTAEVIRMQFNCFLDERNYILFETGEVIK